MPTVRNLSLHHNYYAGVANRNPQPMETTAFDLVNNLLYNADVGPTPSGIRGEHCRPVLQARSAEACPAGRRSGLNYCLYGTQELEDTVIYVEDCIGSASTARRRVIGSGQGLRPRPERRAGWLRDLRGAVPVPDPFSRAAGHDLASRAAGLAVDGLLCADPDRGWRFSKGLGRHAGGPGIPDRRRRPGCSTG